LRHGEPDLCLNHLVSSPDDASEHARVCI